MEQYLRHYINFRQDNWVELLPMAQLAYNNNVSETTEVSSFFANFGIDPNLFMEPREGPKAKSAIILFKDLKRLYQEIK